MELLELVGTAGVPAQWQGMTITYTNGSTVEALLIARGSDFLRVAIPGDRDIRTFHLANGTWFSEDGELVKIDFAGQRNATPDIPTENECVCPKELASHLMSLLLAGGEGKHLVEDSLYVLSPEGNDVRVQIRRLYGNRMSAMPTPLCFSDSALPN